MLLASTHLCKFACATTSKIYNSRTPSIKLCRSCSWFTCATLNERFLQSATSLLLMIFHFVPAKAAACSNNMHAGRCCFLKSSESWKAIFLRLQCATNLQLLPDLAACFIVGNKSLAQRCVCQGLGQPTCHDGNNPQSCQGLMMFA